MSVKEKLLEKIETMTPADLEWLNSVLEAHEYLDIRVDYGEAKRLEMIDIIEKLGAPSDTDMTDFNNSIATREVINSAGKAYPTNN
jgi:hypothetical protein